MQPCASLMARGAATRSQALGAERPVLAHKHRDPSSGCVITRRRSADAPGAACGLDELADGPAGLVLYASKVRQYLAWLAGAERCLRSGPRRARRRLDLLEIS
jgi:hypothetical protein